MTKIKNLFKVAGVGIALTMAAQAQASVINVGGVTWDPDSLIDFAAQSVIYETNVSAVGDVLRGIGKVSSVNGGFSFCGGCELTFEFSYTVTEVGNFDGNLLTDVIFNNGSLNFYVDNSANFDFQNSATASDGVLWLALDGHANYDANLNKTGDLISEVTSGTFGMNNTFGSGTGLFDVIGGMAAGNFDTNTKADFYGNPADFLFTSSFQPFPGGGSTAEGFSLISTGELSGNSIPEPGSLALFGLGMMGLASLRRKPKAQA